MKMFTLIDIGERAGSGIPNIYSKMIVIHFEKDLLCYKKCAVYT